MFNPRPKMANSSRFSVLWHFTLFGFSNFQTEREGGAKGDRLAILHALPSSEFLFSCHCQPAFAFRVTGGEAPSPSPSPAPSPSQSSCFWDLWAAESESKLPTGEFFAESDSKLAAASLGRRTLSGHGGNCYSITEVLVFSSLGAAICVVFCRRKDMICLWQETSFPSQRCRLIQIADVPPAPSPAPPSAPHVSGWDAAWLMPVLRVFMPRSPLLLGLQRPCELDLKYS